jgi:hypothetical protein
MLRVNVFVLVTMRVSIIASSLDKSTITLLVATTVLIDAVDRASDTSSQRQGQNMSEKN